MTPPWYRTTRFLALAGSLLMWLALPPVDWWPLAWVAPLPWLLLVRQPDLEVAGHFAHLAVPASYSGWRRCIGSRCRIGRRVLVGSRYRSIWRSISRVHRRHTGGGALLRASRWCSPRPSCGPGWPGKGHLLSGFTMGSLEHTQFRWLQLIQVADLMGATGSGSS